MPAPGDDVWGNLRGSWTGGRVCAAGTGWRLATHPCHCTAPRAAPRCAVLCCAELAPVVLTRRRQLEERCRDLDIHDLKPFFDSSAFQEAGFRLAQSGQQVLLARA